MQTFLKENCDEILPAHYTWRVPEKGFKIENFKIKERTILVCAQYSIKYGNM